METDCENDFVTYLVHEIGHTLGLGHSTNTAMDGSPDWNTGRYLTGDDIAGLRAKYSGLGLVSLGSYFREYNNSTNSWGSAISMGGSQSFQPRRADVGASSGGTDYVISSAADQDGNQVHFKRAAFPLGSSPSWTNYAYTYDTWNTPAITSNHTSTNGGAFLAAFPEDTVTWSNCGSMRFLYSSNGLASATSYTKTDMCTLVAPALEWVDGSSHDFYLIMWLDFDFANDDDTGEILYRTSSNGTTWGTIRRTGIYSNDTPGLACGEDGECQIVYPRASADQPELIARAFTISSSGVISLGSWDDDESWIQREGDVAFIDNVSGEWLFVEHKTSSGTWQAKGWGSFYSTEDTSNPSEMDGTFGSVGESSEHPAKLAGNLAFPTSYMFYVD